MISALFVETGGGYFDLPGVDPWDEVRDARKFEGPGPVVAHPPCARWCQMARLVEKRYGYKVGDDGGLFDFALSAVRRWGGVLEHPAYSIAWKTYGLAKPPTKGGWVDAGDGIGLTCHVEQGNYGHRARKATWLYLAGFEGQPPELRWGKSEARAWVSALRNPEYSHIPYLSKKEAKATPVMFRDTLLELAALCG